LCRKKEPSGERRRLGHINKQGNSLLRFLLVEAAQVTVLSDPRWRNQFFHWRRRLAVRLYWMWRRAWDYEQLEQFGSHAGQP
jgi:transposase